MAGSARPGAATLILHPGADKRKAAMLERFKEYRPKCLFVVDAAGRFCGKPYSCFPYHPESECLRTDDGSRQQGAGYIVGSRVIFASFHVQFGRESARSDSRLIQSSPTGNQNCDHRAIRLLRS